MTIKVTDGRSMWSTAGKVTVSEGNYGEKLFVIENADITTMVDRNEFKIVSLHQDATDVEHDSARLIYLEGAGLNFVRLAGRRVLFTGVILKARYYPPGFELKDGVEVNQFELDRIDTCMECENPHLLMPYLPPMQDFKPQMVDIEVSYYMKEDK